MAENFVQLLTGSGHSAIAVFQIHGEQALGAASEHLQLKTNRDFAQLDEGKIHFGYWHHQVNDGNSSSNPLKEDVVCCRTGALNMELHTHSSPAIIDSIIQSFSDKNISVRCVQEDGQKKENVLSHEWTRWFDVSILATGPSSGGRLSGIQSKSGDELAKTISDQWNLALEKCGLHSLPKIQPVWIEQHQAAALQKLGTSQTSQIASIFSGQLNGGLFRFLFECLQGLTSTPSNKNTISKEVTRRIRLYSSISEINRPTDVLIFGHPNVGKSSLINKIVGFERAIVSDQAGTTRDLIHQETVIGGLPFRFYDSAGLRETSESIESQGIERTNQAIERISNRILVLEPNDLANLTEDSAANSELTTYLAQANFVVLNKVDLLDEANLQLAQFSNDVRFIPVSAKTELGIADLMEEIEKFGGINWNEREVYSSVPLTDQMKYWMKDFAEKID